MGSGRKSRHPQFSDGKDGKSPGSQNNQIEPVTFSVGPPSYSQKDSSNSKNNKEDKTMDKREKFEKMAERMKSWCTGEGDVADCCSMMRKMMECCQGEETTKKKQETEKTGQKVP
jgi:hypothetical protein